MTTTVSKTIGTSGRDYSTLATWAADCPPDLTAVDQIWKGLVYNDSEFSASFGTGSPVVDSTRYMWLTTGPGQSHCDHASKDTNPVKYDQSKGVGIRLTGAYVVLLHVDCNYTIIEKIQLYWDSSYNSGNMVSVNAPGTKLRQLIYQSNRGGNTEFAMYGNCGLEDSVIILNTSGGHTGQAYYSANPGNWIIGCTFVAPSDMAGANGIYTGYSNFPQILGCAVFGFGTPFANASMSNLESVGSNYNATDGSSVPGAASLSGLTYASQFEGVVSSAMDFRAKSTGGLGAGYPHYSGSAGDVVLHTRGSPNQTIGGWEITATGPPPQLLYPISDVATNSWLSSLGGALYAAMDEATADPADYAYSPNNPTTEEFEVALTVAGSPGSGKDLIADYQLHAVGLTTNFRLTLMCGSTQIDQWTDSVTVADGDKTNTHTVLAANANSITNYADLRLRGRASA